MKQTIQLSDHFTYGTLIRFTLPSVGMTIFTSIYGMVDGFFISNYVGKTAFAAVNLIIPFLMILGGIGAMLGVGGSALVAKTLGEGDSKRASRYFTMMMYLMLGTSVLCTGIGNHRHSSGGAPVWRDGQYDRRRGALRKHLPTL